MQAALDLQAESLVGWLNSEKKPDERSPRHIAAWYYSAPYGVYATRDGHLAISITPLKLLSEALEDPRLLRFTLEETWDPARKEAICDLIAETIRTRETDHWISRMQPLKIWHARVQGYADIVADPQVQHMKCIVTAPGAGKDGKPVTLVNHPVRYDGQAAEVHLPPQPLGGQTEDVLAELGFGAAEIEALERDGVVRRAQ